MWDQQKHCWLRLKRMETGQNERGQSYFKNCTGRKQVDRTNHLQICNILQEKGTISKSRIVGAEAEARVVDPEGKSSTGPKDELQAMDYF